MKKQLQAKDKSVFARISTKLILLGLIIGFPIILFSARQTTNINQRASTISPTISSIPSQTSLTPACIPYPPCLHTKPKCDFPQPAIGWCPQSNQPLTTDQINTLLIYLSNVIKTVRK